MRCATAPPSQPPFTDARVMEAHDAWVADRTGSLGVYGYSSAAEERTAREERELPEGALVRGLADEGAGKAAGLLPQDVIVNVGDVSVADFEGLRSAMAGKMAGDTVRVTFSRAGQLRTVDVVLRSKSGW